MTSATDNRTTELLPCPFCGGEAETFNPFNVDGTWCVLCSECAAATGFEQTEVEAIVAWNTRAELGSGTCEITDTTRTCNDDVWTTALCSACGAEYTIEFNYLNYCPNCGKAVKR